MDFLAETEVRVLISLQEFQVIFEAEKGMKIKTLRSNRGGEFNSSEFDNFCVQQGMKRQLILLDNMGWLKEEIELLCPW